MESALLKHLPQLLCAHCNKFSRPFEFAVSFVVAFSSAANLLPGCRVLALRVIGGFHLNLAQSDDVRPTDNPKIFALSRSSEPTAKFFLASVTVRVFI
jgi:hypothetical protein